MSAGPFRFLHAADFHLERPLHGAAELPDHLQDLFLESPYRAAERLLAAAVTESVDFVVLAGDLLDPHRTGPRGPVFLLEQFRRLQERGIAVYWVGGQTDAPEQWPAALELPPNVHRFEADRVQEYVHRREGRPLASICGQSRARRRKLEPASFRPSDSGLFSIAVAHAAAGDDVVAQPAIRYWALGGRHSAWSVTRGRRLAHAPGTPQGRLPAEAGPHGCTLVHVDASGDINLQPIATDLARYCQLRLTLREETSREHLEALLREKIKSLMAREPEVHLLVCWSLAGQGPLWRELRREGLARDLLAGLQHEFGYSSPTAWSLSLSAEPVEMADDPRSLQETLLGDYLRSLEQFETDSQRPLLSAELLSDALPAELPANLVRLDDPQTRRRVLREAATLGLELLSGEE